MIKENADRKIYCARRKEHADYDVQESGYFNVDNTGS